MNATLPLVVGVAASVAVGAAAWRRVRASGLDRWMPGYLATRSRRRAPAATDPVRLFLCVADHFEPKHGGADPKTALARVRRWADEYPKLVEGFRDADGRPPQHTFFYPAEEYEPELLDKVQRICRAGYGEIEIHLHHDGDTSENLAANLEQFKARLSQRHESLGREKSTGKVGYVFIHGNWALDNSRPDGGRCGVNNELTVLQQTGCYADMTFPSAPDPTQPPTINTIYRAVDDPMKPRSHDYGVELQAGKSPSDGLLMIPGPLTLNWRRKKFGLVPRVENACLQGSQPFHIDRLEDWLRAGVRVAGRPDWRFVKLHTHGAVDANADALLGPKTTAFHRDLARLANERPNFHYHYVTAREMVNVILAAEAGAQEWRSDLRDFKWSPPPVAASRPSP